DPLRAEAGQRVEQFRVVLLLRVEEGVARRAAEAVAMSRGDRRPLRAPLRDAGVRHRRRGLAPVRLVVVGDEQPDVPHRLRCRSRHLAQDTGEPDLGVAGEPDHAATARASSRAPITVWRPVSWSGTCAGATGRPARAAATATESAAGSSGGTHQLGSGAISGTPPTAEATNGRPHAIASIRTFGTPSERDGRTSRSAARYQSGSAAFGCRPTKVVRSASPA